MLFRQLLIPFPRITGQIPAVPTPLKVLFLAGLILSGALLPLRAQLPPPFKTLEAGLHGMVNTNRNVFHTFWRPGMGLKGYLGTPFYFGEVQVGIHLLPHTGRQSGSSDFHSILIDLGWGYRLSLPRQLAFITGFAIGSNLMIFVQAEGYSKYESELAGSLDLRLSYLVRDRWAINLSSRYQVIFTARPIRLAFLSAGASYLFATPEWLRIFLE